MSMPAPPPRLVALASGVLVALAALAASAQPAAGPGEAGKQAGKAAGEAAGSAQAATPLPPRLSTHVRDLAARLDAEDDVPRILDVRTPDEYAEGHIPGALNIPHDELAERLDELGAAKTDEIVVHCESGRRARTARRTLHDAGYRRVVLLRGHMQRWRHEELPLERGAATPAEGGPEAEETASDD